jgi:hypothetical protein
MNAIFTIILGCMYSLVGLFILALAFLLIRTLLKAIPALWEAFCDVRWKKCIGHAAFGCVISLFAAPNLPAALTMAAGVISTLTVAFILHKLEQIELRRPAPVRVGGYRKPR